MTVTPVDANVVLTSDNTQYDQAMNQSAQSTDRLGTSLDSLSQKMNNLAKSAGRKFIGISMADVGVITAATAAWSSYEQQVSLLNAQAAILSRSQTQAAAVMKDYTGAVNTLRTTYGATAGEAATLVETLAKITNITQTRSLTDLSKVFMDMSKATGESSEGLADSLTNLQKVMGVPVNAQTTRKYADTFTYLAAQTNASAQGLIDFTSQLAPIGRAVGLNTKQVAGFATMFVKAGQDGTAAATVFTKVAGDISKSMATGSPEIAHYANLVGMTQQQFKKLGAENQIVDILEALQRMGPRAAAELDRLGLDGVRSMRSITAVLNQPGGIRQALGMAEDPNARGATQRGAQAAMQSLNDEFDKLRENLKTTAETMGSYFAPMIEKFLEGMNKAAEVVNKIVEGPLGKFAALIMGILAPLAGGVGTMLLFAGALLKVASAFAIFRSSMAYGFSEGKAGGAALVRMPDGTYAARGTGPLMTRGQQLAQGGTWLQRYQYNTGQLIGSGYAGIRDFVRQGYQTGREMVDPNYVPGVPRSMASYMAGGAGRLIGMIGPSFDQMRYADPTKRTLWLQQQAPWSRLVDRVRLSTAMGDVSTAQTDLSKISQETARLQAMKIDEGTHLDPVAAAAARDARLDELKAMKEETQTRLSNAQATEQAMRANILATQDQTKAAESSAVGLKRLAQGVGSVAAGMGGGVLGAGRWGLGALARSPMAMPLAGMLGMGAMSALGVQDQGPMFAAMGSMFGLPGALIGGALGFGLDVYQQRKQFSALQTQYQQAVQAGVPSQQYAAGQALQQNWGNLQSLAQPRGGFWNITKYVPIVGGLIGGESPQQLYGAAKAGVSFLTGGPSPGEQARAAQAAQEKDTSMANAFVALAGAEGKGFERFTYSAADFQKLDQIVQDFQPAMQKLGITVDDVTEAFRHASDDQQHYHAWFKLQRELVEPGIATGEYRQIRQTAAGAAMLGDPTARASLRFQANVGDFYQGVLNIYDSLRNRGLSDIAIMRSAQQTMFRSGDENSRPFELQMSLANMAQQNLMTRMPLMAPPAAFNAQLQMGQMWSSIPITPTMTQTQVNLIQAGKQQAAQAVVDQVNSVKQLLLQQDQFNISQQRAQQDFATQRTYAQEDYDLQRTREEEQFQRMQSRATQDYYIQKRRAEYEFNLQRQRQEADYNHSVELAIKQQAQSMYDIYTRQTAVRTYSAESVLASAQDQVVRMREQETDLRKLRREGLTTQAIQQLGLTDPKNQQQLARFVTEMTPQLVRQLNEAAGSERIKAAGDLFKDQSNLQWREMQRSENLNLARGQEDFNRHMDQGEADFKRNMARNRTDFGIMMDQQVTDYNTMIDRQLTSYHRMMNRAREDIANSAKYITGSITGILKQGSTQLTGYGQQLATAALNTWTGLRTSTRPAAIGLMTDLARILHIQYTPPQFRDSGFTVPGGAPGQLERHGQGLGGMHSGGVVPGYTPGRDTHTIAVGGGEGILRPEATRLLGGEKFIEAVNHASMHGGFAAGGVFRPINATVTRGLHDSWTGYPAVDLATPVGTTVYAVSSGTISRSYDITGPLASDTYHDAKYGPYGSYGRVMYLKSILGPELIYAHLSKRGYTAGTRVVGGQPIGLSGSSGNSSGPHLHFGDSDGNPFEFITGAVGAHGTLDIGDLGQTGGRRMSIWDVLRHRYPKVEAAAAALQGARPLESGMISMIINRFARQVIQAAGGLPGAGDAFGDPGRSSYPSNEAMVHAAARHVGWGDEWSSLYQLVMSESGFNNTAQNPTSTAYGMFQFLDPTWAPYGRKTSNPRLQTKYGLQYIRDRYMDPNAAWAFHKRVGWYGDGSVFTQPNVVGVGEKGPEAVIPLNDRGGEFLYNAMAGARGVGMGSTPVRGGSMNIYKTQIDRSTNFTGPITVTASNPADLVAQLQARQRVLALSRPALTTGAPV